MHPLIAEIARASEDAERAFRNMADVFSRKDNESLCRHEFKSAACGYGGTATSCRKTITNCRMLENEHRFGGLVGFTPMQEASEQIVDAARRARDASAAAQTRTAILEAGRRSAWSGARMMEAMARPELDHKLIESYMIADLQTQRLPNEWATIEFTLFPTAARHLGLLINEQIIIDGHRWTVLSTQSDVDDYMRVRAMDAEPSSPTYMISGEAMDPSRMREIESQVYAGRIVPLHPGESVVPLRVRDLLTEGEILEALQRRKRKKHASDVPETVERRPRKVDMG